MAADQSVFVPDQSHHENVEDRQHYEAEAVRVRKTVELVDDEKTEDAQGSWIGPELISEQTDNEEHLNDPVAEQIESVEVLGAEGKILREAYEMCGDKVIWILNQFVLGDRINQAGDGAGADEG